MIQNSSSCRILLAPVYLHKYYYLFIDCPRGLAQVWTEVEPGAAGTSYLHYPRTNMNWVDQQPPCIFLSNASFVSFCFGTTCILILSPYHWTETPIIEPAVSFLAPLVLLWLVRKERLTLGDTRLGNSRMRWRFKLQFPRPGTSLAPFAWRACLQPQAPISQCWIHPWRYWDQYCTLSSLLLPVTDPSPLCSIQVWDYLLSINYDYGMKMDVINIFACRDARDDLLKGDIPQDR